MADNRREWFRDLRKTSGYTQETLAQKIGVKRQFISMIENDLAKPSVANAKLLGKTLGFEWTRLFEEG